MRRSIRLRLIVWVMALLVPLSVAAGWLLIQAFGNRLSHDIDVALTEEAETVGELLATPGGPDAASDLLAHIVGEGDHGPTKQVTVTRDGQLIFEAPAGAAAALSAADSGLRIVRYESPDSTVTVSIGVSAAAASYARQRLSSLLAFGLPLILALSGGGLWLVIGRALRPLEQAAQRLDAIGPETLSVRLPIEDPDDEVGRMTAVLNRMLERLERAVVELRRFTADAAHELRTPLTILRTGLDVALTRERSAPEYRAALAEALASTERMCRLADDLLTLARLEAVEGPRGATPLDLSEVLQELADAAAGQYGVTIIVGVPATLYVNGNAGDLCRLFNNLIENAVRHSVRNGQIALAAQVRGGTVEITVCDSGPGIAADVLPRIFDRFYRGNNGQGDGGAGLGLSIAQEIARTHGGRIAAANRAEGGCTMTVTLPLAAAPFAS